MSLWYTPTMPDEEFLDKGAREVSKYMMVRLFEPAMPELKKAIQTSLGAFAVDVREKDPDMADKVDNIRLDNEAVMDIFYDSMENNEDELEVYDEISGEVAKDDIGLEQEHSEAGDTESSGEEQAI